MLIGAEGHVMLAVKWAAHYEYKNRFGNSREKE